MGSQMCIGYRVQLEETTWIEPTLKKEATRQEELKWGKEYDMILKKRDRYDEQKGKVFALLMNQCDEPVKNKIDGHEDYAKAEKDRDVIALLVKIKTVTHDANEKKYPPQQAVKAWKQLVMIKLKALLKRMAQKVALCLVNAEVNCWSSTIRPPQPTEEANVTPWTEEDELKLHRLKHETATIDKTVLGWKRESMASATTAIFYKLSSEAQQKIECAIRENVCKRATANAAVNAATDKAMYLILLTN